MKRLRRLLLCVFGLVGWAWLGGVAAAQDDALTLYVRRNFGYGGGDQIQGNFRLEVDGPSDLVAVTYLIDGRTLATAREAPFRIDFETDSYPHGWHDLSAVGERGDGSSLTSATRRFEFVSAEVGWQAAGRIGGLALGGVAIVMVIVIGLQVWLASRDRKAGRKGYGFLGGTVCPKCGRPFGMHIWGLNALGGKYDRCDHCGKWSFVSRASPAALEAAEAALAPTNPTSTASAADRLERQIDETRYIDEP